MKTNPILFVVLGLTLPVCAATLTWDITPGTVGAGNGTVTGGTGAWNLANGNWTPDGGVNNLAWVNNVTPDSAIFGGTAGTVTLGTGISANSLTFNTTGYSITGNTLTLGGTTPTISAGVDASIGSILAGSNGLTKTGVGTLTLTGANNYTGGTTISTGTLRLGDGTTNPTVNSTYDIAGGATLRLQYNASGSVAQTWSKFTGAGTLALTSGKSSDTGWGILTLPNAFTGTLVMERGRSYVLAANPNNHGLGGTTKVVVRPNGHFGMWENGTTIPASVSFELEGTGYGETGYEAALRMANTGATSTIQGPVTLTGNATIGAAGTGKGVIAQGIGQSASASLTVGTSQLNGTIELQGAASYTGDTNVNRGTLLLSGGNNRLPTGTTVNFTGTSTLNIGSTSQTLANLTVGSNSITGTVSGSGTLNMGGSNFTLGGAGQILNMSALKTFNYSGAGQTFLVSGTSSGNTLTMAENSTVTAASFRVGYNTASVNDTWMYNYVNLGSGNNVINTDTLYLGYTSNSSRRDRGYLTLNSGTLTLRNQAGTGRVSEIAIGKKETGTYTNYSYGEWNTSGGTVDALVATLLVGWTTANNGGNMGQGVMTLGSGTFDATTAWVAPHYRTDYNNAYGTQLGSLTLNGTDFKASTFWMGRYRANADVTLNAGATLSVASLARNTVNALTVATFTWNDGTIRNYDSGTDFTIGSLSTFNLAGVGLHAFDVGSGRQGAVNTVVSGVGTLTKVGSGTLILSQSNTYNGATLVNAGTFNLTGGLTGGTAITVGNDAVFTSSGTISGAASFTHNSSGTSLLGGTLSYTGATQINTGVVQLTGALSGGTAITVSNAAVLNQTAGVISGAASLNHNSTGTSTLAGANTFTGGTTVNNGLLVGTTTSALGTNSGLKLAGGVFEYKPTAAGALALGTGKLEFASGSRIGTVLAGTASQSAITSSGAAVTTGTVTVDISGIPGVAPTAGVNNLITAGSGLTGATYALGNVYNASNFTVSGLTSAAGAVSVTVTGATALSNVYWKGGYSGGNNVWALSNGSTASNWASNVGGTDTSLTPGPTTTVNFSATSANNQGAMTLGDNMSIAGIVVNDTNALTLNADGKTLTLGAGGLTVNSGAGATTLAAPVVLNGNQTWTNDSSNTLTASGGLSGSGTLAKAGSGTLALTGANTYAGATTISGGVLEIGGTGVLGGGAYAGAIVNNASLVYGSSSTQTFSGPLSGTGALTKNGVGILTLSGTATYSGNTTVTGGTMQYTNASPFRVGGTDGSATLLLDGGKFIQNSGQQWFTLGYNNGTTGTLTINDGSEFQTTRFITGWNSTGSQGIVNMNGGTFTASGATDNYYLGYQGSATWNQSGGVATFTGYEVHMTQIAGSSSTVNLSGGTLRLTSNNWWQMGIAGGTATMNISGTGNFQANAFLMSNGAANSVVNFSGGTFAGGTAGQNWMNIGWTGTGGATWNQTGGNATFLGEFRMAGASSGATSKGTINLSGGTLTIGSSGQDAKFGQYGVATVNQTGGLFNYVGTGGLWFANMGGSSVLDVSGGTFNSASSFFFGVRGTATLTVRDSGSLDLGANTLLLSYSGLPGTGQAHLNSGGTLRVGAITRPGTAGTFNFNGGTLVAGKSNTAFMNGLTRANVRDGGAVIDTAAFDITIAQALLHSDLGGDAALDGGLNKLGTGTLTLSGANTYTGLTTINDGTLAVGNASALGTGGTDASRTIVGSGGALNLNGNRLASEYIVLDGGWLGNNSTGTGGSGTQQIRITVTANGGTIGGSGNWDNRASSGVALFTVNNGALLTKTDANTINAGVDGSIVNNGEISIQQGVFALTRAAVSGTGFFTVAPTGTLYSFGTANNPLAVYLNGGTLRAVTSTNVPVQSGSVTLQADSTVNVDPATTFTASGVLSQSGGAYGFTKIGTGTFALSNAGNNFTGALVIEEGTVSAATVAPLAGAGSGSIQIKNAATLQYTGTVAGSLSRGLLLTNFDGGKVDVSNSAGSLAMTSISGATSDFVKTGPGTFSISGSSEVNKFYVNQGTYSQTGGTTVINTTEELTGLQLNGGHYRLEAGTLRTDRMALTSGGSFAWGVTDGVGYATLTMKQEGARVEPVGIDRTGSGGAASGPVVKEGTHITVTGDLTTTNRSILDLGPTYYSNARLYDNLSITGTLNLSAADDTLNFEINPYFLRPSGPNDVDRGDWGTLVLVRATGITGVTVDGKLIGFDNITGIGNDVIGWTQHIGVFTSAAALPINTWYVQTIASGYNDEAMVQSSLGVVLFHYKVSGSVPEPASAGLMVAGAMLLRALRRRK